MAIDFLEKKVVFPQTQRERIRLAAKSQCAPKFKNPPRAKVLKVSVLFKVGESELTTCPGAAHVPSFGGFSLELFVCQLKRRQYANHRQLLTLPHSSFVGLSDFLSRGTEFHFDNWFIRPKVERSTHEISFVFKVRLTSKFDEKVVYALKNLKKIPVVAHYSVYQSAKFQQLAIKIVGPVK